MSAKRSGVGLRCAHCHKSSAVRPHSRSTTSGSSCVDRLGGNVGGAVVVGDDASGASVGVVEEDVSDSNVSAAVVPVVVAVVGGGGGGGGDKAVDENCDAVVTRLRVVVVVRLRGAAM